MQCSQFRADSVIDLCRKVLIAALAMQIALPNRTALQLPAKAGLVQIAESLSEPSSFFMASRLYFGENLIYDTVV